MDKYNKIKLNLEDELRITLVRSYIYAIISIVFITIGMYYSYVNFFYGSFIVTIGVFYIITAIASNERKLEISSIVKLLKLREWKKKK